MVVWIALWIVNTYSKFQVNIFINYKDITKCHNFWTMTMTTPRLKQYLGLSSKTAKLKVGKSERILMVKMSNYLQELTLFTKHFPSFAGFSLHVCRSLRKTLQIEIKSSY